MATAIVVTGASRGFGRAMAVKLTEQVATQQPKQRIDVFLWARGENKLQGTKDDVEAVATRVPVNVHVTTTGVDLGDQASYVPRVDALVQQLQRQAPAYTKIYIVHNAASVGALGPASGWTSASELATFWELNLNHVCYLNAKLLAAFQDPVSTRLVLINVSSNVAVTPFPGCGLYCTSKAAREMHFRVLAEETKSTNRIRIVNYWPGALDTQMQDELRDSSAFPDAIHQIFVGFKEHGKLATPEDSASFCVQEVVKDEYITGTSIDFDSTKVAQ